MSTLLSSILFFIVTLGILVTIHEFGHYWVARKLGVKVLRFSVGFGKPLWSKRAGADQTEYAIGALPLGGYVKMLDENEGPVAEHEQHRAFNRQPVAKRFAIVFAGPLFNFIFAIVAYWLIFVMGVPGLKPLIGEVLDGSIAARAGLQAGDEIVAVEQQATPTWDSAVFGLIGQVLDQGTVDLTVRDENRATRELSLNLAGQSGLDRGNLLENLGLRPARPPLPALIGELEPNGAAAKAGLVPGDKIIAADGEPMRDWLAWASYVRDRPGRLIQVDVERQGKILRLEIRPEASKAAGGSVGRIGAAAVLPEFPERLRTTVQYGPLEAVGQAFEKSWQITALTFQMLGKMIVGQASVENLSGPISIAQFAGDSASGGLVSFLRFLAIISISLGILNLLPVPLLDGGHLMYYLIEAAKGSPVSARAQLVGQQLGIILLMGLTILAVYNDLTRVFGPHS